MNRPAKSGAYWMRPKPGFAWSIVTVSVVKTQVTYYQHGNGKTLDPKDTRREFVGPIKPPSK